MGSAIVQYLRDPALVRSIQEKFGVQEISLEVENSPETDQVFHDSNETNPCREKTQILSGEKPSNNSKEPVGGSLSWIKPKKKVRRRISTPPPESLPPSSPQEDIQDPPHQNSSPRVLVVETIPFLDIYFRLATELGYEPFYITFLPLVVWNMDTLIGRRVIIMWCLSMYIGQGAKQLFKIRRPASPPAIRLEQNPSLESEYGFPSTHATVGATIPFCILYCIIGRYEIPFLPFLLLAFVWWLSVIFSRIYLGVHSVLDVVTGSLISIVIFPLGILIIKVVEDYAFDSPTAPIGIILLTIFMLYIYPVDSTHWSRDRGDTGAILGSTMGVVLGHCALGRTPDDVDMGGLIPIVLPSIQVVSLCLVRFVVGLLLVLPARFVMKLLCFKLLPRIMPTHGVEEVVKRPLVELPYKIITYGGIGFTAIYVCPIVFEICNISRWDTPLGK